MITKKTPKVLCVSCYYAWWGAAGIGGAERSYRQACLHYSKEAEERSDTGDQQDLKGYFGGGGWD